NAVAQRCRGAEVDRQRVAGRFLELRLQRFDRRLDAGGGQHADLGGARPRDRRAEHPYCQCCRNSELSHAERVSLWGFGVRDSGFVLVSMRTRHRLGDSRPPAFRVQIGASSMKRLFQATLLLLVLLTGSTPLFAHHGNASYENKEVTIKGK